MLKWLTERSLTKPKLYEIDEDGSLIVNPHPGQYEATVAQERFIFILAGSQSGKTSYVPIWLYNEIMNTCQSGEENDYLAVTASFDLFKLKFLPEMVKFFCDTMRVGRYWAADRLIELKCLDPDNPKYGEFLAERAVDPMWGRIILRSAQSEGGLESSTAKAAVLDECGQDGFTINTWEAVLRRLSLSQGRVLGATTLYYFGGWLYNLYRQWIDGDKSIRVIQFPSYMNPNFDRVEYERAKASMPDWKFAMFYEGKYRHPAGLIYRDFDESIMVVDDFTVPREWERVIGIDFGGANLATLWFALNPNDGRWYIYRETLMGHMPTAEHVAMVKAEAEGIEKLTAVGGAKSESQQREDWWYEGFYVEEPPVSNVEVGIARFISLIKRDRLRVFRSCEGILNEFRQYRRKLDSDNNPTEQIIDKNKFHFCDAGRYASSWIEDVPPGVEALAYDKLVAKFEKEGRYAYA